MEVKKIIEEVEKHEVVQTADALCQMYRLKKSDMRIIITCDGKGSVLSASCMVGKVYNFKAEEAKQISDICKKMAQQNVKGRQSR